MIQNGKPWFNARLLDDGLFTCVTTHDLTWNVSGFTCYDNEFRKVFDFIDSENPVSKETFCRLADLRAYARRNMFGECRKGFISFLDNAVLPECRNRIEALATWGWPPEPEAKPEARQKPRRPLP